MTRRKKYKGSADSVQDESRFPISMEPGSRPFGEATVKLGGSRTKNRWIRTLTIQSGQSLNIWRCDCHMSGAGGSMKTSLSNLIVISSENAGLPKIHISRRAVLILAAGFLFSFCSTVFVLLTFPRVQIRETDRSQFFHLHHETDGEWQNTYLTGTADLGRNVGPQSRALNQ